MFIGVDLVEIPRIAEAVKNPRFLRRIYTPAELAFAQELSSTTRKAEFFAGRFAVKEATYKAVSALYQQRVRQTSDAPALRRVPLLVFTDIEALNRNGLPILSFHGQTGKLLTIFPTLDAQVSLSHTSALSTAVVLLRLPD